MVKLKKLVVYAACGLMLASAGNGLGSIEAHAEEPEQIKEQENIGYVDEDSLVKASKKTVKKETIIIYYPDGTYEVERVYEYDADGNMISGSEKDIIIESYVSEFDSNGRVIRDNVYDQEGNLLRYYTYEYDSKDRISKVTEYVGERLNSYHFNEYYGDSYNYSKITSYDGSGGYDINEYANDTYNNCIKTSYYNSDDTLRNYWTYEYDSRGNEIKSAYHNSDGSIKFYDETKYDENDNLIAYIDYDAAGNVDYRSDYTYEYDSDGDITSITQRTSSGYTYVTAYEYYGSDSSAANKIVSNGIYCAQTSPSIVAGLVVDNKSSISGDIEYQWLVCDEATGAWSVASDWTKNNEWMNYTPVKSGNYVFLCNARIAGQENTKVQFSFGTPFVKQGGIKEICQMPYEGGGYLIGFESYENPNQEYQYEMFVMDLSLLEAGSPTPWVHATGKIKLPVGATAQEGKTMWTIWQPQYGYYLTLFRLYDKDGNIIDEVPYGFANAY